MARALLGAGFFDAKTGVLRPAVASGEGGNGEFQRREVVTLAKGKYQYWLTLEGITLLTGWARDGLTDEQIAHNMGCSRSTLNVWRNAHADISDALKKGRAVVDYEVENDLVAACHAGNVTAMIFYLKNRRADRWKDRPEDRSRNDSSLMRELVDLSKSPSLPLDEQEGGPE